MYLRLELLLKCINILRDMYSRSCYTKWRSRVGEKVPIRLLKYCHQLYESHFFDSGVP